MKSLSGSFRTFAAVILIQFCLFFLNPKLVAIDLFVDSGQKLGETSAWSVSLADLDGDQDLDALIDGRIWLNDSKGFFTVSDNSIGGEYTVLGDLNNDGFIDLVYGNNTYLNDGAWTFLKQEPIFGGSEILSSYLLDLDADDDLDVIAYTENSDRIWYNDGQAHFQDSGKSLGGWGQAMYACGDLNNDGFRDIYASIPHTPPPTMSPMSNKIWLSDGKGDYTSKNHNPNIQSRGVVLADFDKDGDLDLFLGKGNPQPSGSSWSKIFLNDGQGNFTDSGQKINSDYNSPNAVVGDLDNDGDVDLFIINGMPGDNGQPNTIWLNDGAGKFIDSGLRLGKSNSLAVALGDLDADGDLDAFVVNVNLSGKASQKVYINTTINTTDIKNGWREE